MLDDAAVAVEIWFRGMRPWPTWHADASARPHGTDVNPHVFMPQRVPVWEPNTHYDVADRRTVDGVLLWCAQAGCSGVPSPTVVANGRTLDGSCIWFDWVAPSAVCPCGVYQASVLVNGKPSGMLLADDPRAAEANAASLQHAIQAASGGGTVVLPAGQFHLADAFRIGADAHAVEISGAGPEWSSFIVHDADAAFEIEPGANDVAIRSLKVIHASSGITSAGPGRSRARDPPKR